MRWSAMRGSLVSSADRLIAVGSYFGGRRWWCLGDNCPLRLVHCIENQVALARGSGRCEHVNGQRTVHATYASCLIAQARKISRISFVDPRDCSFRGRHNSDWPCHGLGCHSEYWAGAVAAAGLLSVVFAVLGFGLDVKEDAEIVAENTHSTPPLVHDPFGGDQRPRWPPKSAEPMQYERH